MLGRAPLLFCFAIWIAALIVGAVYLDQQTQATINLRVMSDVMTAFDYVPHR